MKHWLPTLLFVLLLASCSGQSLLTQADADTILATKTLHLKSTQHGALNEEGHYPDLTQEDGSKTFTNDLGLTLTLESATLHWGHFHLISDGDDPECDPGHDVDIELDIHQNLMSEDLHAAVLASAQIEDRGYCRFMVHFTPSEEDGVTARLTGLWTDGVQSGGFNLSIEEEFEAEGIFASGTDMASAAHPLHYHEGQTEKNLTFAHTYDEWFDGVDFSEDNESLKAALTANILDSFHQHLGNGTQAH